MGISSEIDTKQLLKALEQFPKNIQKNVLTGAVRAGANVVRDQVKANTPKDTGNLAKSIGTTKRKNPNRTTVRFSISPRKGKRNNGFYGRFIEFGTSKMRARPFMRPVFENQSDESIKATKKYLAERIDKEVRKTK